VLAVLLGNADDLAEELFPAHVGQYAEEELTDVRGADGDALVFWEPQVAQVKESVVRPL